MPTFKLLLMYLMSLLYLAAGIMHFIKSDFYLYITPSSLPGRMAIVYISGVIEIMLGLLLLFPQYREMAAWGIIGLLVAVYPANIYHCCIAHQHGSREFIGTLIRLPFQFLFIAWAYWYTK